MATNRELIKELVAARKRRATPSYRVTLGKSVATLRSLRVDIAQLSTYIVGMPDMGKSNLLARLFLENQDHSKILIDPQGKMTNEVVLPNIDDPSRVIYFAPYEQRRRPLGFNPFDLGKTPTPDERDALAGRLVSLFVHLWLGSFGKYPNMEMVIQNSLKLLVQFEGMTFLDMTRLIIDKRFRTRLARQAKDPDLRTFWLEQYTDDKGISTYNKLNQFVQNGFVRRSICQPRSSFYLDRAMKAGKTVIVNLGGLPENAKSVIGALFVSQMLSELNRRELVPSDRLTPFALFVDEFDLFGSQAFETIISKCRQQKSSVCIAHQHWGQISASMQQSVLQSAYLVAFQVDALTARQMRDAFHGEANLAKVPRHYAWVRVMKMKTGSEPEVDLIKTKKAPDGDPEKARAIKQAMWPLGRPVSEVTAETGDTYDVIERYNVIREPAEERYESAEATDESEDATPAKVQPTREEYLPRTQADWPARFRHRPSAVFAGVGQ